LPWEPAPFPIRASYSPSIRRFPPWGRVAPIFGGRKASLAGIGAPVEFWGQRLEALAAGWVCTSFFRGGRAYGFFFFSRLGSWVWKEGRGLRSAVPGRQCLASATLVANTGKARKGEGPPGRLTFPCLELPGWGPGIAFSSFSFFLKRGPDSRQAPPYWELGRKRPWWKSPRGGAPLLFFPPAPPLVFCCPRWLPVFLP